MDGPSCSYKFGEKDRRELGLNREKGLSTFLCIVPAPNQIVRSLSTLTESTTLVALPTWPIAISPLRAKQSLICCKSLAFFSSLGPCLELCLRYYQVIMTIDIFQYSNMYTVRKSIQWLADESHVKEECGPYVTKPGLYHALFFFLSLVNDYLGRRIADWPKLLHLYSRLKPGICIYEWMKAYSVEDLGVDVRRFTSFGVIKVRIILASLNRPFF